MADAPRPFWYLAGAALMIIAVAVAIRISNRSQPFTVSGGGDGVTITMGGVEKSIAAAQTSVAAASTQLDTQRDEISTLEGQVHSQQDTIQALLNEIDHLGAAAPPALRSSAKLIRAQTLGRPPMAVTRVDANLLKDASAQLAAARASMAKLATRH